MNSIAITVHEINVCDIQTDNEVAAIRLLVGVEREP